MLNESKKNFSLNEVCLQPVSEPQENVSVDSCHLCEVGSWLVDEVKGYGKCENHLDEDENASERE